jgi:acyl-CoA synthetase (AMP-forming)/AMP-acid ligase II
VKIQGFRVELSEIEFHLRAISGSANVVALAISNASGLSQVHAVFEGAQPEIEAIMEQVKTKLPSYMIPSGVHFIAPFPLNANGKTDRKKLQTLITESV